MEIVENLPELRRRIRSARAEGRTIGFVPTMGYLHEGHLSLVRAALERGDWTVVSIFVNPLQFGPDEDYERYPRDPERDAALLSDAGADLLFLPSVDVMYPDGLERPHTQVVVPGLRDRLCGRSRPGHFDGVAVVVTKLFHMVEPDRAYFGQKDFQQTRVVRTLIRDLAMPVELEVVPIAREADGLAMSSRNAYLTPEQRAAAPLLYRVLREAEKRVRGGERDAAALAAWMRAAIAEEPLARLDYAEIVDPETLEPLHRIEGEALLALAVYFGSTRLIDNLLLKL